MADQINNSTDVEALVASLLNPLRKHPACVLAIPVGAVAPLFDLAELENDFGDIAKFYVIPTGNLTRQFADAMPDRAKVFGSAARAFPHNYGRTHVAGSLYYGEPASGLGKATAGLTSELWGYANAANLIKKPAAQLAKETVKVKGFVGTELAILKRANGDLVSYYPQTQFAQVPVEALFEVGQQVDGYYNPETNSFSLHQTPFGTAEFLAEFGYNTITLGLVTATTRRSATVAVHPNLSFEVPKAKITHNDRDVISEYLDVNEVYPFRLYKDDHSQVQLRCDDIEDYEIVYPAVALLSGGQPWINEEAGVLGSELVREVEEFVAQPIEVPDTEVIDAQMEVAFEAAHPAAGKSQSDTLSAFQVNYYRSEMKRLKALVDANNDSTIERARQERAELIGIIGELKDKNAKLRSQNATLKSSRRSGQQASFVENPWDNRDHFSTYEEWLAWEVQNSWIKSYEIDDRERWKLDASKWSFGKNFFDEFSPQLLNETQLRKLIRTIVDVVTGRARSAQTLEVHELTDGGGAQQLRGSDRAMRAYVEEKAASARRLHYWLKPGGAMELSNVVTHDTYDIHY